MSALESMALSRTWFYPFQLPGGSTTSTYDGGALDAIHFTRRQMLDSALARLFGDDFSGLSAVDIACHQGWFACHLAARGFGRVLALDARAEHVADASLMRDILGHERLEVARRDVHETTMDNSGGPFDLTLCFGLIYHLENPVGALRVARALCRRACLIETQVVPGMSGMVDYGSYRFVRPLKGSFGVIDETDDTHGPEASTTGICLVPSTEALLWILRKVGFARAEVLPVPEDGYEQLVHGKRVMVLAQVD
ncbi:MAG TPA: methyltransferase domain-containing protein [Xanthomonadaceae bacterium]|nr:methyltransferase domain-containing protein [Xanthomonadaceae bacterium]